MPAAAFTRFNALTEAIAEKLHDFQNDSLRLILTNVAPAAAMNVAADITEIGAGNGYSSGGIALAVVSSAQAAGVYRLILSNASLTASGGSIGPFRYAVIYNDTAPDDELIGFFDYGSSITLGDGETLNINFDAVNGLFSVGA